MRATALSVLLALVSGLVSQAAAQDAQAPVFRAGVDLLEVDLNIVDGNGRPITDLTASEFSVKIDGQSRKVVSSEFIRDNAGALPDAASREDDPYVASNTDRIQGRMVIIVVDQNNITAGRARDMMASVRRFVEQLPATDRVALAAIPSPGPAVEFTANRERIYQALLGLRGTGDENVERYDVGNYEAIALSGKGDEATIRRLIERECQSVQNLVCISELELEADRIVTRLRLRANESYFALTALLNNLKEAPGTKSLLLLSQGFIFDDVQGRTSALAQTAAESRVNLNVVLLDETPGEATSQGRSNTVRQDRDLREEGLEALAGKSRGALFRVTSSPDIAFDRLALEMSGHYLLGVEPTQKDRDGSTHQIRVQVKRPRAIVRARQEFRYDLRVADTRAREEQVVSLLRSPAMSTELPMRLSTYVFQDPESGQAKLLVATEVDPSSTATGDLMCAFALIDGQGRAVATGRELKTYTLADGRAVEYIWAIKAPPGTYALRFAAIDGAGRRGSLEHDVRIWAMSGSEVTVGDLMLGRVDASNRAGAMKPVVSTSVDNGQIAIYTEFYSNHPETLDAVTVTMEVAEGETGPAVLRERAAVRPRVEGAGRQALVVMLVKALPPGRYFARAVVTSGGEVVGRTARAFEILPTPAERLPPPRPVF